MRLIGVGRAAAAVVVAAALVLTQGGTAFAQSGPTLSGYPTFDNTMTVSNETWSDKLPAGHSEYNWYHCGDYHKIVTPNGVMSAWPYGPMSWGILSGSGWTSEATHGTATANNMGRNAGDLQILFINATFSDSTSKIRMDCTGVYPGYETEGITVQSPTEITPTAATIHASADIHDPSLVGDSRAYVEYGSRPGSYDQQTSKVTVPHATLRRGEPTPLPPIRLSGLTPGTTYHYRVVFDEGDNWRRNNPPDYLRNYGAPNNTFTTAVSPQAGQTYGIASFADGGAFIEPKCLPGPGGCQYNNLPMQLYEGNGNPAQQWNLVESRGRDGYFKIVRPQAPGVCLEIFASGPLANAPIDQWTCAAPNDPNAPDQPNQLWRPVPWRDGSFLLQSKAGGGLLLSSAGGTANGTGLVARSLTAAPSDTQKWSFIPLRAEALRAKRPKRGTKVVRCRGGARRCRARIGIAGGAVNRKIIIRLPARKLRLRSVKVFPRRIAAIEDERAAGAEQLYSFSDVRHRPRRKRFVVILNAAKASPPGSHLILKFKGPRQRDRQRRRP